MVTALLQERICSVVICELQMQHKQRQDLMASRSGTCTSCTLEHHTLLLLKLDQEVVLGRIHGQSLVKLDRLQPELPVNLVQASLAHVCLHVTQEGRTHLSEVSHHLQASLLILHGDAILSLTANRSSSRVALAHCM